MANIKPCCILLLLGVVGDMTPVRKALSASNDAPILLYVHIPFCNSKCHFCDWVTGISPNDLRMSPRAVERKNYIHALTRQIKAKASELRQQGYQPHILYWGGGTASQLEASEFDTIMGTLHSEFDLTNLQEATMECSPETLSLEKLQRFHNAGFKRLSIGVQSLDDQRLRKIGRAHNSEIAIQSLELAERAGFSDVNIDIISGFPDETLEEFIDSFNKVIDLPFSHCSLYPYRAAQGTVMVRQMHKNRVGRTWLEEQLASYDFAAALLKQRGYDEYAMSHFGTPQCISDLTYFRLDTDWIGFGSGATSLYEQRYRAHKRGSLREFNKSPIVWDEDIPAHDPQITSRLIYQALTTYEGISRVNFEERLGIPFEEIMAQPATQQLLSYFKNSGFLIEDKDHIRIKNGKIAEAFIRLLFLNAPKAAQQQNTGNRMVGGY